MQMKTWHVGVIILFLLIGNIALELFYLRIIAPLYGYHYWISSLLHKLLYVVIILITIKIYHVNIKAMIIKPDFKEVGLITGIAMLSIITFLILTYPREYFNALFFNVGNVSLPGNGFTLSRNIEYIIISCIIAPIVEEIFWRGILLSTLIKRYNKTLVILILSVVFAGLHFRISFFVLILLSIFASYIYIKSKSLTLAILFHLVWNSFSFTFSFFRAQISDFLISHWYILIFSIGSILIWFLFKIFSNHREKRNCQKVKQSKYVQSKEHNSRVFPTGQKLSNFLR